MDDAPTTAAITTAPIPTLTYEEAEKRYHCHKKTIYNKIKAGLIKAYKPGETVLIDMASADAWFFSTQIKPKRKMGRPRKGAKR